ncbi:hypothetical protein Gogos_018433 [Gossypium gossypioides]|uniref:Uncharacterized protein n=1 Tax=Gossypium gossypioides TaxID=34282 RepID=A0A7J9BDW7_GOSGO|nr:hypothetical protein [Gossypium gossypioides]
MRWLDDNFQTIEASTSDVEKEQSTRAVILRLMGDLLMPDKFCNLHLARESVIGHFCKGRDAQIRPSDTAVWVYDYLPMCEPYLTSKLATSSDYMDWFRHYGKLCLLPNLERSKQYRRKRPRRGLINPRSGGHVADRLTSALHAHPDPVPVQPPG